MTDVNGLKRVNDSHGHLIGDRLIQEVAGHVSAAAGRLPSGLAARIGGDEFLIASPCSDQALVRGLVDELTGAAERLSFGDGVSCGIAWAGALLRPEASSQSLIRSLLRIADSEQYRDKLAARGAPEETSPGGASDGLGGRRYRDAAGADAPAAVQEGSSNLTDAGAAASPHHQVEEPLGRVTGAAQDTPLEERLAHTGQVVCALAGGVAWWVSEVDQERETISAVSCGTVRETGVGDGLWPMVELDPNVYNLADFPTTARAVREGGLFYVDTLTGDAAERQLLIQTGFQSMIAAGDVDDAGRGWLVEVYGDSLTRDLREFATLLQTATTRSPTQEESPGSLPSHGAKTGIE